jgi:hypothetical protein
MVSPPLKFAGGPSQRLKGAYPGGPSAPMVQIPHNCCGVDEQANRLCHKLLHFRTSHEVWKVSVQIGRDVGLGFLNRHLLPVDRTACP